MEQYLPVVTMLGLAVVFVALSFAASTLLAPSRPTEAKSLPYESGIVPVHEPAERFPVRFYIVAMLFIVFDIEIIFLYPWAVAADGLGLFGLVALGVFIAVVFVSLLWEIAMGGLEWGPVKRLRPVGPPIPSGRTTGSTVRRVSNRPPAERAS